MKSLIPINENSPLEEKMELSLKRAGLKFKSQFSLMDKSKDQWNPKYILDFLVYGEYCKIAIECDGITYHSSKDARQHDTQRDIWVKQHGIQDTLRFDTNQILNDMDSVMTEIHNTIAANDKLYLDKQVQGAFNPNQIPKSIGADDAQILIRSLQEELSKVCKDVTKTVKIRERRKGEIRKRVRDVIQRKGFADLKNLFGYFALEKLASSQNDFDCIFGAFNVPCTITLTNCSRQVKIPKDIAEDESILKIIVLYEQGSTKFKGSSYIVLDGFSEERCRILKSDILGHLQRQKTDVQKHQIILNRYQEHETEKELLNEVSRLETELRQVYQKLYQSKSFRSSINQSPFENLDPTDREKIVISISRFLSTMTETQSSKEKSIDIAFTWLKQEGIYFKHLVFTLHELTLAIHYLRKM